MLKLGLAPRRARSRQPALPVAAICARPSLTRRFRFARACNMPFVIRIAAAGDVHASDATRERVEAAMEVFFPGSSKVDRRFAVKFDELREREPTLVGPASVTAFVVKHASGAPAYALRVEYGGKVITYSGDTEWTESLVEAARGADLFVCEAYFFEKKVKYHLDCQTLRENRQRLDSRRVILTHMSADMLRRRDEADMECANDGQVIVL